MASTTAFLDLPQAMFSRISQFLDMEQLLDISRMCKSMYQASSQFTSFNGKFIVPPCITGRENAKILHRFSNCKIVCFPSKDSLDESNLKAITNSWPLAKRNNVEVLKIEQTFDNTHLDLLKSCFPNIKTIQLTVNGKNDLFYNNAYCNDCVIPLLLLYTTNLNELHIEFDTIGRAIAIPNKMIKCLQNVPKLRKFTIAGISMDWRNKNIDTISTTNKLFRIPMNINNRTNEILDSLKIPLCGFCVPVHINHNYINELKLNWDVGSQCLSEHCTSIYSVDTSLPRLEKLTLRLHLNESMKSSMLLNKWIQNILRFNNIYELRLQLFLTRDLWSDHVGIVIRLISELLQKIVNNRSNQNYKCIIIKICETDCGNASYLYLLKNILCTWVQTLTNEIRKKEKKKSDITYAIEIIVDHKLPELLFIDGNHYKPMALGAINDIFENILNVDDEISFRLLLNTSSPRGPSYEEFYNSLKRPDVKTIYCDCNFRKRIILNYVSQRIKSNNKQQLVFNVCSSTIFEDL